MQALKRKLIWLSVLVVFILTVIFLCFCFVPLEDYIESDHMGMKMSHQIHHVDKDIKDCPGCHPFLWRFYFRCSDLEQEWKDADPKKKK